jgi:hypothetical protein
MGWTFEKKWKCCKTEFIMVSEDIKAKRSSLDKVFFVPCTVDLHSKQAIASSPLLSSWHT